MGAVMSPGTYFLTQPHHTRCCTPLANIRARKNTCKASLLRNEGASQTITQNIEKTISNKRNTRNGILNKYHLRLNPIESSSIE